METNQLLTISPSQLRHAADLKERIEELNRELSGIFAERDTDTSVIGTSAGIMVGRKKRGMSAEGRRRIGDAARARWARVNAAKGKVAPPSVESASLPKRRTMSAASRKKIADAARARWAKIRAAKARG